MSGNSQSKHKSIKAIGVIPARYASTRLPGKPLVKIRGISLIERVFRRSAQAQLLSELWVATDDLRIAEHVEGFGGKVCLTSPDCPTGTDRLLEARQTIGQADVWINIQGDEPFVDPKQIDALVKAFEVENVQDIATLIKRINSLEEYESDSEVKVVSDCNSNALYFSRAPIPWVDNRYEIDFSTQNMLYKHVGLYAFTEHVLNALSKMPQSPLEEAERLEQLRWLEAGMKIKLVKTEHESRCVDTPQDVQDLEAGFDSLFDADASYFHK